MIFALPAFGMAQADQPAAGDDESGIPSGLLQRREVRPEFEITKELISDGEEAEFKKKNGEAALQNALKSSNPNEEEKKALDAAARWFVYRMSMVKYREEEAPTKEKTTSTTAKNAPPKERLPDIRKKVLDTLRSFGTKSPAAREYFLKQLTEHCETLLDNNFYVRLNAVLLLGQVSINEGNLGRGIEPPAYDGAYPVLLSVLQDEKQHEAIRVAAALGLTRICRTALKPDISDKRRIEIGLEVAKILAANKSHWWLQMRCAECLAACGIAGDPGDKANPVVLQTLTKVVADKQRHWEVRVEAARAIGRIPLDSASVAPITVEIVRLGQQLAQGFNANKNRDTWSKYFWKLYLAFRKSDASDKVVGDRRKAGLLDALPSSKEIKDAYEQVLTITNIGLDPNTKQFSKEQLDSIEAWLSSRKAVAGKAANNDEAGPSGP